MKIATGPDDLTKDIRKAIYAESYEASEARLVRRNLREDDRVLELGGGVGFVSLLCAKICGANNLTTYEPNPTAVAMIERNFALNGLSPNVHQAAAALEDGKTEFFMNDNVFSSSLLDRKNEAKPTPVTTCDIRRLVKEHSPSVVVMDIEGAETDILPHAASASVRAMLVELHPHIVGQASIDTLVKQMEDVGYRITDRADDKVVLFERRSTA